MKLPIQKVMKNLSKDSVLLLLSFVKDEDLDFIKAKDYTTDEMREEIESFFCKRDDATLKVISKDLLAFNLELHNTIFSKKDKETKKPTTSSANSNTTGSLTPNQSLVIDKIRKMMKRNGVDKVRTDLIEVKDKSKFFVGGVLTTLVEKKLISIEIDGKKKFVSLISI